MNFKYTFTQVISFSFLIGTVLAGRSDEKVEAEDSGKAVEAVLIKEFTASDEDFVNLQQEIVNQLGKDTPTLLEDSPEVVAVNEYIEDT
ncbi:hypothetical protein A1A1_08514 [Planococcus antarcticus DSM 14505]|uniref:Inhibitor I9 domain-containing protein n=1 Tax=Planococcus antarcticus DSM 14505 TaxID=1185653 RepID=A0A1C7DKA3_9BACL|nr:hypothetical protein [Planococcus antarcticus]ANU11885.1 hypothetical protein BBH88_17325 [Planococcus antarcticus DSM 14505]EIM06995.1 hypothetical protein A1A1_08514 [Planococcus antarcticus DSM 14505]